MPIFFWVLDWVGIKEKSPGGLYLYSQVAETRGFEPPIRVLAPMLP